jgi:hypothetical protein
MFRRSLAVCVLVALLAPRSAGAQNQSNPWYSFAQRLPLNAFVVVHLIDGTTVEGHLIQVTPDSISALPKTRLPVPVREVVFADVQSIEVRREGMSPGAAVLTGVGSAGGIVLMIVMLALTAR